MTTKRMLRKELRAHRRSLVAGLGVDGGEGEDLALSAATLQLVADLSSRLGRALVVAAYESLPGEPPTTALISALQDGGHRVIVPVTLPDFDLDWETLPERTRLGLEGIATADLIITPGLAVDGTGMRMGQGGGCYDRALPRRRPEVRSVVVLHDGEFHPSGVPTEGGYQNLPRDEHDQCVDGVLTPGGGLLWLDGDAAAAASAAASADADASAE